MTYERAARILLIHLHSCGVLMPEEWVKQNGDGSPLQEAFALAIDTLKDAGRRKENSCEENPDAL